MRICKLLTLSLCTIALAGCATQGGLFGPHQELQPQDVKVYHQGESPQGQVRIIKQVEIERAFVNHTQPITQANVLPQLQAQTLKLKGNAIVGLICTHKAHGNLTLMHCIGDAAKIKK